jgi:hypothetical protein
VRKMLLAVIGALALVAGVPASIASGGGATSPDWAHNPRLDEAGDFVTRLMGGDFNNSKFTNANGSSCAAEPSGTPDVQVNCLAEDGGSSLNTESETSVAAMGSKVVVGFNDSLVCCVPAINLTGYSVSTDGGAHFTDMGDLPAAPGTLPIGDPTVAHDADGNFYFATLALNSVGIGTHSEIAFYKMPAGSSRFQLVSTVTDVGSDELFFADKEYLAVGTDGSGRTHFYISWTFFSRNPASPIMLSDSTDGVHWRTNMVSTADACAQGSTPLPAGGTVFVSWNQQTPASCASPTGTQSNQMMATVDVSSGTVVRRTSVAAVNGNGDKIVACNRPTDLRQVIETAPGHDIRNFELPAITRDGNGVLYMAWNDRPNGPGGPNSNATRIFLSFSRDNNVTWSTPQVISGTVATDHMSDRFQPWLAADASGLHAMWYERVKGATANSEDVLRTDKEDLTLATPTLAPVAGSETQVSSVTFPVIQTNPNQDPIIANCYMGDYNNIVSTGTTRYVTWGDNRNVVTTSQGVTEHQPDVFLFSY